MKDKIREKIDLNKKITAEFRLKSANAQKEKEEALQEIQSQLELQTQTTEQLSAALDQQRENSKTKDEEVEMLKNKLVEMENESGQKDLNWQETLLELQNLKLEIEKRDQEKIELDSRLQASVGQDEFEKSITDRNKLIANLKKRLKEERTAKKEEMTKWQHAITEKDAEIQQLEVMIFLKTFHDYLE